MEQKEFIELYAPHNAKNLTQEQLGAMAGFTKEQIALLAQAYPNNQSAYLILKDKNKENKKQVYPLSTWKNLLALWKVGQTQFVAISFRNIFNRASQGLKTAPVQDLTKDQVKNELKVASSQNAASATSSATPQGDQQIAKEEGNGNEELFANLVIIGEGGVEKPIDKWNKKELTAEYVRLYGQEPEEGTVNKVLVNAIKERAKPNS